MSDRNLPPVPPPWPRPAAELHWYRFEIWRNLDAGGARPYDHGDRLVRAGAGRRSLSHVDASVDASILVSELHHRPVTHRWRRNSPEHVAVGDVVITSPERQLDDTARPIDAMAWTVGPGGLAWPVTVDPADHTIGRLRPPRTGRTAEPPNSCATC